MRRDTVHREWYVPRHMRQAPLHPDSSQAPLPSQIADSQDGSSAGHSSSQRGRHTVSSSELRGPSRADLPRKGFWSRPARHHVLSFFLWLVTLAVMGAVLLRFAPSFASNGRRIPGIAAFVPWFTLPLAVFLVPAITWRRRFLVMLLTLCLGLQLAWHAGYLNPLARLSHAQELASYSAQADASDAYARLMTLNTKNGQADAAQIISAVRDQHVEVLALQEVTGELLQRLDQAGIRTYLPHRIVAKGRGSDNGGVNALYMLSAVEGQDLDLVQTNASAIPVATLSIGGKVIRFGSVHLASPWRSTRGFWNADLASLRTLNATNGNLVLLGDFNSTWDHSRFRKMLGTGFRDASEQAGEGLHMTYPSNSKIPPMIEIDHIVYSDELGVIIGDMQTLEIAGTDHMALLGTMHVG